MSCRLIDTPNPHAVSERRTNPKFVHRFQGCRHLRARGRQGEWYVHYWNDSQNVEIGAVCEEFLSYRRRYFLHARLRLI